MRVATVLGLLFLGLFAQVHAADDSDWNDVDDSELTLRKDECQYHRIKGKKSDIRVQIDTSDDDGCDPATTLSISSSFVFDGECFKKNLTEGVHECLEPGPFGLSHRDICDNLDDIGMEPFKPDEIDGDSQTLDGAICFGESTYYLAFVSTCKTPMKLKLEVDRKGISSGNQKFCEDQETFRPKLKAFIKRYAWVFITVGVVLLVLIIGSIILCVCCCACCCAACKKKPAETTVIVQQGPPPATEPLIPSDTKV